MWVLAARLGRSGEVLDRASGRPHTHTHAMRALSLLPRQPATHNLVQCMVRWPHISSRIMLAPWWLSTTARADTSAAQVGAEGAAGFHAHPAQRQLHPPTAAT